MKFIKTLVIIIVLAAVSLFSYQFYMENYGVKNRVTYEKQKHNTKKKLKDRPVKDFFNNVFKKKNK